MPFNLDILGKHDALMLDLFAAEFGGKIPNKTPQVLWASPKKRFMEYVTRRKLGTTDRVKVPRISVQRLGSAYRQDLHNFNPVRCVRLETPQDVWVHSNYPTPVTLAYQVDFWTLSQWQMNYWERHAHLLFWGPGSNKYVKLTIGEPWADKFAKLTLDSIDDNTDIEPAKEKDKTIRKSLSFSMDTWTYPELDSSPFGDYDAQFFQRHNAVKSVSVSICDFNGEVYSSRHFA